VLYRERDPNRRGLVTLVHPWNAGSTRRALDEALRAHAVAMGRAAATRLHAAHLLRFLRRDTKFVPSVQRPTDSEVWACWCSRSASGGTASTAALPASESVLIEDLAFNSILAAANRSLTLIADELGQPVPSALQEQFARTDDAIEQLWDEESGQYFSATR